MSHKKALNASQNHGQCVHRLGWLRREKCHNIRACRINVLYSGVHALSWMDSIAAKEMIAMKAGEVNKAAKSEKNQSEN